MVTVAARRRRVAWLWSALVASAALVLPIRHVEAGSTARWSVDGYDQWDEGDADSAFITSTGAVKPGWKTTRSELEVGGSWAAVRAGNGVIYLGSDDKAAVWAVSNGKARKLASVGGGAVAVVALALGPGNALYAGTMPGGQVWRIDRSSGKASKLTELKGVETVWSLAMDRAGHLFAGTGPDGKLFRIDTRTGASHMVFDSNDRRILSMVATYDGALWFGTSDDALLFRHDPARGTTRAMADFAGNEVTALAEYKGSVVAAANEIKEPSTSGVKTTAAVKEAEGKEVKGEKPKTAEKGKPGADKATPSGTEPERKGERKGKGGLYRVRGDGQLEQLHSLSQTYFSSVVVNDAGQIFAGAGDKGRIYLIDADDSVSTAFDVTERQISQLLLEPGGKLAFVTGDATALYRSTGRAGTASYTSKVFDAQAPARFGSLGWRSSGGVAMETRSGNTEEPGPGWSGWQKLRDAHAAGGGGQRAKVASPPGRYLQFRARLTTDDAVLRQTGVYYLPQNRPTRLTEVTVSGADVDKLKTLEQAASTPRSPVLKLKWKVENEDSDETVYKLAVRREGDVRWRPIATGGKPLTAVTFDWNTETYPDGYYRLRVTASDRRANPDDRALDTQLLSAVFAVDNQKPTIGNVSVKYPAASARATDALSPLSEVAFSVDDGAWQLAGSQDGLLDDTTEILKLRLPDDLESGAHTLAIRVADEAGNIGSAAVTFRVP
ncbi:MAG TPA: WD40 repeat domain-containing protein [Kofleriaceae bacterium]|nr:WD40 repeat domain-containing protein [Kofleriaceae bacterium]